MRRILSSAALMQDAGDRGRGDRGQGSPVPETDKEQMFVDILPEGPADDGVAYISFYLEPDADHGGNAGSGCDEELEEIAGWGVDDGRSYDSGL